MPIPPGACLRHNPPVPDGRCAIVLEIILALVILALIFGRRIIIDLIGFVFFIFFFLFALGLFAAMFFMGTLAVLFH